jgi:hypothetical protein
LTRRIKKIEKPFSEAPLLTLTIKSRAHSIIDLRAIQQSYHNIGIIEMSF